MTVAAMKNPIENVTTNPLFSDKVLSRYRIASTIASCGSKKQGEKLAKEYLHLLRLKEELDQFIWDMDSLKRDRHIIYAIDDVVLSAYVEMNKGNRRSFSFPITEEYQSDSQLESRGAEYNWRLEKLFFTQNNPPKTPPLLILPSAMPGLANFAKHLANKGDEFKGEIEKEYSAITKEEPEIIKAALDQLANNFQSDSKGNFGQKFSRGDAAKDTSTYLSDHLLALHLNLWNLNSHKKQAETFTKLMQEGQFCFVHSGLTVFKNHLKSHYNGKINPASIEKMCLELAPNLATSPPSNQAKVNHLYRLLMETDKLVFRNETQSDSSWTTATNYHYLNVINQAFEKFSINAEVQLITHRQKLPNAIRALGWEKQGVPLRHPKFLAAALDPKQHIMVAEWVNKISIFLNRMVDDIDKIYFNDNEMKNQNYEIANTIKRTQENIANPWISMKSCIYLNENVYNTQSFAQPQPGPSATKTANHDRLIRRFENKHEDLLALAKESLDYEWDYLVYQVLSLWAINQKVFISFVPELTDVEMAHIMIAPIADRLRYVIKIPAQYFLSEKLTSLLEDKTTANNVSLGMAFNDVDIITIINALDTSTSQSNKFALALCASVSGNWAIVEQLLKNDESSVDSKQNISSTPDIDDPTRFLIFEGFHLRQFGLRSSAARAIVCRKQIALKRLDEAGTLLKQMNETSPFNKDYRYKLSQIGWNLEVHSTLVETYSHTLPHKWKEVSELYPSFQYLQLPEELAESCLDFIGTLTEQINIDKEKNKENKTRYSQVFYWHYIRSRACQLIIMIMAATKANLVPDQITTHYSLHHHLNDLNAEAAKGWGYWDESLALLSDLTGKNFTKDELRKKFNSATFLLHWYKLQNLEFSLENQVDPQSLQVFFNEVMESLAIMEDSCSRLLPSGFPRRVFGRLLAIEYPEQRDKLREIIFRSMKRLEERASQTYQNW